MMDDICVIFLVQNSINIRKQIKKKMASNPFPGKYASMSSSSIFSPTHNEFKRISPFPTTPFDPFAPRQGHLSVPNSETFPRAMASQSMIANNSSARRTTFGKLESMARKVTTTVQDETGQERPQRQEMQQNVEENVSHSMIMPTGPSGMPFLGMNRM
jgi:hypothetical protein